MVQADKTGRAGAHNEAHKLLLHIYYHSGLQCQVVIGASHQSFEHSSSGFSDRKLRASDRALLHVVSHYWVNVAELKYCDASDE